MRSNALTNILLWGLISCTSFAQNLVPNPSMESYSACPNNTNYYVDRATGWQFLSGHGGSADYFHSCGTAQHDWTNFSDNGTVSPHSGDAYIGMGTYDDLSQREYAEVQLTAPLVAGEIYNVSAWVYGARGDNASNVYTNNIGIYLSATNPSVSGCGMCTGIYNVTPAVNSTAVTQNMWTQIAGTYVATGGEQYLVLGNFSSNASTTVVNNGAASMGGNSGYTFFDDVEVTLANPLPATLISFTTDCIDKNQRNIRWSSISEPNLCYYTLQKRDDKLWTDVYTVEAKNLTFQTSYYSVLISELSRDAYLRLKMEDCDGKVHYSEVINSHCNSSDNISIETMVSDGFMGIVRNLNPNNQYSIQVFSTDGKILQDHMVSGKEVFVIRHLSKGLYHISVAPTKGNLRKTNGIIHIQ